MRLWRSISNLGQGFYFTLATMVSLSSPETVEFHTHSCSTQFCLPESIPSNKAARMAVGNLQEESTRDHNDHCNPSDGYGTGIIQTPIHCHFQ
jgi:hypothetical protein